MLHLRVAGKVLYVVMYDRRVAPMDAVVKRLNLKVRLTFTTLNETKISALL